MLAIASQKGICGQGRGSALIDFHEDGADCAGEEMLGLVQGWRRGGARTLVPPHAPCVRNTKMPVLTPEQAVCCAPTARPLPLCVCAHG